jgi:hypothetical protein
MADGKHQGLTARIPRDVVARAEKAGARDADWYAGRLEDAPAGRGGPPRRGLKADHAQVLERHRRRRREQHHRSPRSLLMFLWERARRHHAARIAG